MPFLELSAQNLRNLEPYTIKPSPQTNIFVGKNGAGKTNLLESIYLNSLGKSFRAASMSKVISHGKRNSTLFARFQDPTNNEQYFIGVEKDQHNQNRIKVNRRAQASLSALAWISPTMAIQPSETELIDGASSIRRAYIDWLVFHVKHDFYLLWKKQQKLLKHRNQLLKNMGRQKTTTNKELVVWDKPFLLVNEQINQYREEVFVGLSLTCTQILRAFPLFQKNYPDLDLDYFPGWPQQVSLSESMEKALAGDVLRGYSSLGAHRADILIKTGGQSRLAKDVLSRGQKKLLAIVLRLAQAKELYQKTGKKTVLLVDDLFAELDHENASTLVALIEGLETQSFFTCLELNQKLERMFSGQIKVFHVEQGRIVESL